MHGYKSLHMIWHQFCFYFAFMDKLLHQNLFLLDNCVVQHRHHKNNYTLSDRLRELNLHIGSQPLDQLYIFLEWWEALDNRDNHQDFEVQNCQNHRVEESSISYMVTNTQQLYCCYILSNHQYLALHLLDKHLKNKFSFSTKHTHKLYIHQS